MPDLNLQKTPQSLKIKEIIDTYDLPWPSKSPLGKENLQGCLKDLGSHVASKVSLKTVSSIFDRYGIDADIKRFTLSGYIDQYLQSAGKDEPFFELLVQDSQKKPLFRLVGSPIENEGGDKVWGAPIERKENFSWGNRPSGVKKHRVITKLAPDPAKSNDANALYNDDKGPFLFVGFGDGKDFRTKKESLEHLAASGVSVIGVDLGASKSGMEDIPFMAKNGKKGVVAKGTFFHLDTVFRPTPFGALIYRPGISDNAYSLLVALYGKENIIEIDEESALAFGANGRLIHEKFSGGDGQTLFYPEGALGYETVEKLAASQKAFIETKRQKICLSYDDAKNPVMEEYTVTSLKDPFSRKTLLKMVPISTSQALKGGGSVSCLTQLVPSRSSLKALVTPPSTVKGDNTQNEVARDHLKELKISCAQKEFLSLQKRLSYEGIEVISLALTDFYDAQYTRDPFDIRIQRDGSGLDPAQNSFLEGDLLTAYFSTFSNKDRKGEMQNMAEHLWQLV